MQNTPRGNSNQPKQGREAKVLLLGTRSWKTRASKGREHRCPASLMGHLKQPPVATAPEGSLDAGLRLAPLFQRPIEVDGEMLV